MFEKMMNRFYYGKSGKGDFTEADLPTTRMQLFFEMLRIRLSGLVRLNLIYVVLWLPAMVLLFVNLLSLLSSAGQLAETAPAEVANLMQSGVTSILMYMIPCIAITGPWTAGISYVTRNWSRDEHAFIWSDFIDAVKANWKQALIVSVINSVVPLVMYTCWRVYGLMAENNGMMRIPQILTLSIGLVWAMGITYVFPMLVSYELKLKDLLKNSILIGIARLPQSFGVRLLHCVPALIAFAVAVLWQPLYAAIGLLLYYVLIGFSLSRFVTASWCNACFDRYLNSRIEGAKVNQGLRAPDPDDDDEEEEE